MRQNCISDSLGERCTDTTKNDITKRGWVKKRIKYNIVHPYADRYLCLTETSIFYFDSDLAATSGESCADCKFPLSAIADISLRDAPNHSEMKDFEIFIVGDSFKTTLVFKCKGTQEALHWVQCIGQARDLYIASLLGSGRAAPKVTWRGHTLDKKIEGKIERNFRRKKKASDFELLTEDQKDALMKFGNILVSDRAVMTLVVESVLDALNGRHGSEISFVETTKQLGLAVAMWLGVEDSDGATLQKIQNALRTQTEGLLLEAWLKIALDRELKRAYFKENSGEAASSDNQPNETKMPFRGDNCESIFLANFVKGVALKSGTLSDFLQPIVLQVASDPEAFNAKPVVASCSGVSVDKSSEFAKEASPKSPESENGKMHVLSSSINSICTALFETVATSYDVLPMSLNLLVKIIYEISLDLATPPVVAIESKRGHATIFPEADDDDAERLFCTASCGILFLRLLCPALISPLEWGALRDRKKAVPLSLSVPSLPTCAEAVSSRECSEKEHQSSLLGSVLDFLARGGGEDHPDAHVRPPRPAEEVAWLDLSDEELTSPEDSVINMDTSSAAIIIIAHALVSSPEVLRLLDLKIQGILATTSLGNPYVEMGKSSEGRKFPKRRPDPLFSVNSIKQFLHARTFPQPVPAEFTDQSRPDNPEALVYSVFEAAVNDLAELLPLSKAAEMIQFHYTSHSSLVDPSTEKTMRSAEVRKSLINVAKNIQRVANASCVPESQLESYIAETDPKGGDFSNPASRDNHNFMLSSAVLLKRMYRSIASCAELANGGSIFF